MSKVQPVADEFDSIARNLSSLFQHFLQSQVVWVDAMPLDERRVQNWNARQAIMQAGRKGGVCEVLERGLPVASCLIGVVHLHGLHSCVVLSRNSAIAWWESSQNLPQLGLENCRRLRISCYGTLF